MIYEKKKKKAKKIKDITVSNKMFEDLKSLYMTGFSCSWRKARPFAAPIAIFILVNQGKVAVKPALISNMEICIRKSIPVTQIYI